MRTGFQAVFNNQSLKRLYAALNCPNLLQYFAAVSLSLA